MTEPSREQPRRADEPGRSVPGPPDDLPRPTYWPAILALSVCFGLWGILTSVWLIAGGAAGTILALAGWFGELRHAPSE